MLLRPIVSRTHQIPRRLANFCSLKDIGPSPYAKPLDSYSPRYVSPEKRYVCCNSEMLLRPIVSRTHQIPRRLANFCSPKDVGPSPYAKPLDSYSPQYVSSEKQYVFSYLVNSCGLSPEHAISASKRVHFDSPDKPNANLNFLEKHGFTKTQISDLVRRSPKFLLSKPEKFLPKIDFFSQFTGISKKDVVAVLARNPALLTRSLDHRLAPSYDYLKGIFGAEKIEAIYRRASWHFGNFDLEKLVPNVDLLRETGVPTTFIELSLSQYPEMLCLKHVEFKEVVEEVKRMGFDPAKSMFVMAIHARAGKGNMALWDRCYEIYSKWGWSEDDILMAFRKHPNCMICSEKKITSFLEFVVNDLGREARTVARCPYIILFSMERRIIPRCSVVHLLSLKGLVKKDWSMSSVLCPAERDFVDKFVTRYAKELPELHDIYLSKKARAVEASIR
ncbi:hypothetical protein OROHE_025743 [Orobanche hederae]